VAPVVAVDPFAPPDAQAAAVPPAVAPVAPVGPVPAPSSTSPTLDALAARVDDAWRAFAVALRTIADGIDARLGG
jgi:hypothetical protein